VPRKKILDKPFITTIYLEQSQYDRLARIARELNISVSALIRLIMLNYLKNADQKQANTTLIHTAGSPESKPAGDEGAGEK